MSEGAGWIPLEDTSVEQTLGMLILWASKVLVSGLEAYIVHCWPRLGYNLAALDIKHHTQCHHPWGNKISVHN